MPTTSCAALPQPRSGPVPSLDFYPIVRGLLKAALGFYFNRIERFHAGRVPQSGPVLFAANHPNYLTDAFVIGASVPRKVNFVATVRLFEMAPIRWLFSRCGVIPINRAKDDPRAMRSVLETFESCYDALERQEAIAIFPEGITHDEPQLKTVKSGTARMALELEHRHGGRLGLQIVPVGLTFSAKDTYRSDVLVNFGEPIRVASFLSGYPEKKRECFQTLTAEIEQRIAALMLHLPVLERARVVEAVRRLYLDRLRVGNRVIHEPVPPQAGELRLVQAIATAVDFTCEHQPEKAASFVRKLDRYERWLKRLHLPEEDVVGLADQAKLPWLNIGRTLSGLVLAPVALFGLLHRWLPVALVEAGIRRFATQTPNQTRVGTTAMLTGLVSFGLIYGACVALVHGWVGWPFSLWYALALPVASLVAHYYVRGFRRWCARVRTGLILLRTPGAARRLQALRAELIAEIEAARWAVPTEIVDPAGKSRV